MEVPRVKRVQLWIMYQVPNNMVVKIKLIFFIVKKNNQYFRKSDVFSVQNFEEVEVSVETRRV